VFTERLDPSSELLSASSERVYILFNISWQAPRGTRAVGAKSPLLLRRRSAVAAAMGMATATP
jgi:hypothetical protein